MECPRILSWRGVYARADKNSPNPDPWVTGTMDAVFHKFCLSTVVDSISPHLSCMDCDEVSASGEKRYSGMRRLPVLTSTVTAMPGESGMGLPSTLMMVTSGRMVTGNTRFCMRWALPVGMMLCSSLAAAPSSCCASGSGMASTLMTAVWPALPPGPGRSPTPPESFLAESEEDFLLRIIS